MITLHNVEPTESWLTSLVRLSISTVIVVSLIALPYLVLLIVSVIFS